MVEILKVGTTAPNIVTDPCRCAVSHTYTFLKPEEEKYMPNMTSNDNRMEIRRNWDMLMPREYIQVVTYI